MAKAIILAVDDDRNVLNAVERDLRQKYGRDYRILKAEAGKIGLDVLAQLKERNETVALFVVDQRMPEMTGVQFLDQALRLFPEARKVLLTAYADTEAAISAINKIGLDYYLMKPWNPPEEHLYPVLDGLIEEWHRTVRLPFEGIRVVGTLWSPLCHEIKDFLSRNTIPYLWLDIERNEEARSLLQSVSGDEPKIPAVFFPDGSYLIEPTIPQLAEKAGLRTRAENPFYDVIIIGGGPAGLSAAVYASADGLKVLLIERQAPGGQAGNSPKIENFLGFPSGISGSELTRRAVTQARRFGTEILTTQTVSSDIFEWQYENGDFWRRHRSLSQDCADRNRGLVPHAGSARLPALAGRGDLLWRCSHRSRELPGSRRDRHRRCKLGCSSNAVPEQIRA